MVLALVVFVAVPAAGQVQSRPTDPPLVTANNESWYQLGEPIQFAGELYHQGGAAVFFNGNTMIRTGHYNGIPLYADTTIEPFSVVFVPIGRGLMQPYERRRSAELAGTTGSRPPSFPVRAVPETTTLPAAAVPPTSPPRPVGAISVYTSERPAPAPEAVGTAGIMTSARRPAGRPIVSLRRPESNDGVWVRFAGEKWVSAGAALRLVPQEFLRVGEYAGRPVYARRELQEEVIYLPARDGFVAPYKLKD
jgi:hypothetical protein